MASNLNLSGVSLLGFELLGKLILEELQLIRKDVKDEVRKVGNEIQKLNGLHIKLLSKFDEKLNNVIMKQNESIHESRLSSSDVFPNEAEPANIEFTNEIPRDFSMPNAHLEPHDNVMVNVDDTSISQSPSNCTDILQILKGKSITVKEEVSCFEESKVTSCFSNFNTENSTGLDTAKLDSDFTKTDEDGLNLTVQLKNSLSHNKYSICSPLLKNDNVSTSNISKSCTSSGSMSNLYQKGVKSNMASRSQIAINQLERFQTMTSDSSLLVDLEENLNFRCQFCRKPFRHFSRYQSHLRTHTGEKPFTCSLCNKQFALKGNLSKHMLLHKNEKPFTCQICGKRFVQKGSLKSHILLHTRQECFRCDVCDKSFKHLSHLDAHKHIHKIL